MGCGEGVGEVGGVGLGGVEGEEGFGARAHLCNVSTACTHAAVAVWRQGALRMVGGNSGAGIKQGVISQPGTWHYQLSGSRSGAQ